MKTEPDVAIRDNLLAIATVFAKKRELSLHTVSRRFHGNERFLADFKAGKVSITVSKLAGMLRDFSNEWPAGTAWPKVSAVSMTRPQAQHKK